MNQVFRLTILKDSYIKKLYIPKLKDE